MFADVREEQIYSKERKQLITQLVIDACLLSFVLTQGVSTFYPGLKIPITFPRKESLDLLDFVDVMCKPLS